MTDLQVGIDALASSLLAQAVGAHLEGRLRLVAERAQRVSCPQAAASYAQVPILQRAAHAFIVHDAVAHLHAACASKILPLMRRHLQISRVAFYHCRTTPNHGERI